MGDAYYFAKQFIEDGSDFMPNTSDLNKDEYETLKAVIGVYGHLSAKELSDLTQFFASCPEGSSAVERAIKAYQETVKAPSKYEIINGVTFYYGDMNMTDALISQLEKFSGECNDDIYSVCEEDGRLLIY